MDFDKRTTLLGNNVDAEGSVHRPPLVKEAQCTALDHLPYPTTDSADSRQFFSVSPPSVTSEPLLFLSKEADFYIDVVEVPPGGSSGALQVNSASLRRDVNIFWHVDSLIAENGLHSRSRCGEEQISCILSRCQGVAF